MSNNVKKTLVLLLAVIMVMTSVVACSGGSDDVDADPTQAPADDNGGDQEEEPEPTEEPVDLGGMTITIGDWWTTDPDPEPTTQNEEDTFAYRKEMEDKYNFKYERVNIGPFGDYIELIMTSIIADDPLADVFIMHQEHIAAPISQGLLYPLNTLENLDFNEEKWIPQVREMMTFGDETFGMGTGRMEPRLGVFWNKRLFEEAGLDPDLPYDLQAEDNWTWKTFEELCEKNTRDIDNDGVPDVYGLASFSKDFFRGAVFSNDAEFIGVDDNGKFYNATGEQNFLEALEWGISLYEKGYHMPQPEDSEWDWFLQPFIEGQVAMQCAEQYKVSHWADMEDDWGFVIFPGGPKGEMMTVFTENVDAMPYNLDPDYAEKVAFAYNLYTDPTPGYEDDDWQAFYYPLFRDVRAVNETLPLFYEEDHGTISYLALVSGIDYGDVTYDLDAMALTPVESVEKVQSQWQAHIDKANGEEVVDEDVEE